MRTATNTAGSTRQAARFYRAFRRLNRGHRRDVALRILRDEDLLADIYDHFLIQEAMGAKGRSLSWKAYLDGKKP